MSANLEGKCPHCGSPKHGTMTTRWQDAYQCWTVYPHDGPHRRGAICIELCKGQEATKAVNEWIDKTDWVQRNEAGLFDNMLGWHRADCMRTAIDRLRAQIAALQAVPQGVEVPEPPESEMPHVSRSLHSGEGDFQRYRGFEEGVEWARKNARLVPTPPQADAVVVPRPLSKAPTDRPILAFWQSGLGTISDVVHYFDEEGRFVCWCEMLEYEDNGGNLDFVPRDAQWIELPDALRTSAQDHNGEESNNVG